MLLLLLFSVKVHRADATFWQRFSLGLMDRFIVVSVHRTDATFMSVHYISVGIQCHGGYTLRRSSDADQKHQSTESS